MAAADHYDVIIIGSGAGGGTLAWKLAPSGKRILLLERGGYLPASGTTGRPRRCSSSGKYLTSERWFDADGNGFTPEQNYNVGGNTKFYGAALFRLRPEDFGDIQHHGGISPAWPITYDELRAVLREGRGAVSSCTARTVRTRPTVHGSTPYPYPPVQARAAHPTALRRPRAPRPAPVAPADRGDARPGRRRRAAAQQPVHPLRPGRRLPLPRRRQGRRRRSSCVDPALAHPNVDLVTNAEVDRPRDRRHRPPGHRRGRHARRRHRGPVLRRHRRRLLRRARTRRLLLLRSANDAHPERAGQRLGPGRAQLHVPQQRGDDGPVQGAEPHPLPEDAGAQRLVPQGRGQRVPAGAASRWSARPTASSCKGKAPHFLAWAAS